MPVGIMAGTAVLGAGATIYAGSKASKAQKQAADTQVAESRRQYDLDRSDLAPWRTAGTSAIGMMGRAYGLDGAPPDNSAFFTSPGYEFRRDQGIQAVERSAASRGLLRSGAAVKAVERFAEGQAANEYGDWWNRLAGIAGVGQAATNTTVAAGQAATSNINNATQQAGNARASSYANMGSAINTGLQNVTQAYLFRAGGGFGGK